MPAADEIDLDEAGSPPSQECADDSLSSGSGDEEELDDGQDRPDQEDEDDQEDLEGLEGQYDEEDDDDQDDQDDEDDDEEDEDIIQQAPSFKIPSRTISAVEHPYIIKNLDKGVDTFGPNPQFASVLDPGNPQLSVPLYLHPHDPASRPMMSHYSSSHNVVFKITVPRQTGRKRKRGSDEPWQEGADEGPRLRSQAQLDEAAMVRRRLQDNVGRYQAEAVGVIKHTHRYRGISDFNISMKNNDFMNKFTNTFLSADVKKFRDFSLQTGTDTTPNQEIIAPPLMTQVTVPYYYHYSQNPYVKAVASGDGDIEMVNTTSRVKSVGWFIGIRDPLPSAPTGRPNIKGPLFDDVVKAMKMCMEERPVWTRRSIINRIVDLAYDPENPEKRFPRNLSQQIVKNAIQYAGYQFKGGPWRDSLVKYGYDPRTDPNARQYQCLIFRLRRLEVGQMGTMWQEIRKNDLAATKLSFDEHADSHIFDGKKYRDDGKVWQVCDITDPILSKLLRDAPYRPECDIEGSGWYHRGLWAKARAIMKCKMRGIQFGRELKDSDFEAALAARDDTPDLETVRNIAIPTPDLNLTEAEWELVRGKRYKGVGRQRKNKRTAYHFPGKRVAKRIKNMAAVNSEGVVGDDGSAEARQGDDDMGPEDEEDEGDILETVEDENGLVGGLPSDYEDGSEYDEDEGDDDEDEEEDEDDDDEGGFEEQEGDDDVAEQLRSERERYDSVEAHDDEEA